MLIKFIGGKKYNVYFILPVALKYSKDHDGAGPGNVG